MSDDKTVYLLTDAQCATPRWVSKMWHFRVRGLGWGLWSQNLNS